MPRTKMSVNEKNVKLGTIRPNMTIDQLKQTSIYKELKFKGKSTLKKGELYRVLDAAEQGKSYIPHIFLVFGGGYDRLFSAVFASEEEAKKHVNYLEEKYNDAAWIKEEPILEYASDFPNRRNL